MHLPDWYLIREAALGSAVTTMPEQARGTFAVGSAEPTIQEGCVPNQIPVRQVHSPLLLLSFCYHPAGRVGSAEPTANVQLACRGSDTRRAKVHCNIATQSSSKREKMTGEISLGMHWPPSAEYSTTPASSWCAL